MKALVAASPGSAEARHRSPAPDDDAGKRKTSPRSKDVVKYRIQFPERNSSCKFEFLKLALLVLTCCTILTLVFSPMLRRELQKPPPQPPPPPLMHSISRSRFVDVSRTWRTTHSDPRYVSHLEVDVERISSLLREVKAEDGNLRIGLLNFNSGEVALWRRKLRGAEISPVDLEYADASITWQVLYPEWIDEEEENQVPDCPPLPEPRVDGGSRFDVVAVKLPCDRSSGWSRDVARLHLQLSAAKLAASSSSSSSSSSGRMRRPVSVLIVTDCLPIPNLFACEDLVGHEGNLWLYEPESLALEQNIHLPVGSCKLAIPFESKVRTYTEVGRREAYATILHSAEQYVCGAIAAAKSIRLAGSARDLIVLVDESVSERDRDGLAAAGWKVRTMQRIRNPKAKRDAYNEWNYSKFRLWQLTDYDKIVFIDADLLVLRNIDFLFALPEISAIGNNAMLFNSGVMVIEPSNCTFRLLMDNIEEITSYNGGDQGYLNEIFTWWHRIPKHTNFLKHFWDGGGGADAEKRRAMKESLFGADPPMVSVVHYLGLKPWLCYRDYDCNWNLQMFWGFASDAAHATWWRVHDALPEDLRRFCLLPTKMKAFLEYNRLLAEKAEFPDGHWRRNITDPRMHVCSESFCDWKSMLSNWGAAATATPTSSN